MHVIAAKAVCFGECLKPEFKAYSEQVIQQLPRPRAPRWSSRGYRIVSGGTDNHLFLVDLRANLPELTAKKAQETLDLANITCNKNTVPFETRSPFQASGIRLGTPAVTTRGMLEQEMEEIAELIDTVLRVDRDSRRGRHHRGRKGARGVAYRPVSPALSDVTAPVLPARRFAPGVVVLAPPTARLARLSGFPAAAAPGRRRRLPRPPR